MSSAVPDSELKTRHRAMWASGDYPSMVETFLLPLGPQLVEACGIGPGMKVLDVAAGTGNASIPAAQTGADVTASDLTPELLEAGKARAQEAGVGEEGVHGSPFDDLDEGDRRGRRATDPDRSGSNQERRSAGDRTVVAARGVA